MIKSLKKPRIAFLVTLFLMLQMARAMPTPEQIAEFKANYTLQLNEWLDTKPDQTADCLDALIKQLDQCRHSPYD